MRQTVAVVAGLAFVALLLVLVLLGEEDAPPPPVLDSGVVVADAGRPEPSGRWVVGYHVGYQRNALPSSQVDFTSITHIALGAVLPNADGTLNTTYYIDAVQGPAWAKDLVQRAHAAGRKAILMVGGAGAANWPTASADATRAAFVRNLLTAMDAVGADGLDLDWERDWTLPAGAADRPKLLALARELRQARPGILLTFPAGWLGMSVVLDAWFAEFAAAVDQVNLMTYGMAGAWPGWQSWYHAPLSGAAGPHPVDVTSTVERYLAAGVPAKKLGIGAGFYGLCYTAPVVAARQALNGATASGHDMDFSFTSIRRDYFAADRYRYDDVAKMGYLTAATPFGPRGCTFLSYEDERSLADKAAFAKAKGLGGVIIWTLGEGVVPGATDTQPLLHAVKAGFLQ